MRYAIAGAGLLVLFAFSLGLSGPFVLDDHVNLARIWAWMQGVGGFHDALLGNSGPIGRPLAYLTFMANAAVSTNPLGFKFVNLLLHLFAAALALILLRKVIPSSLPAGPWLALAVGTLWAIHPMQVSTVLYVVQRMTLLSGVATLAALVTFVEARQCWPSDPARGRLLLFGAFPALVLLGLGAKETALLAPGFALVLEAGVFRGTSRPREVTAFFLATLALPLAIGATVLALDLDLIAANYAAREFSLVERMLTQPRVLGDYAATMLAPTDGALALYRDGYQHSSSLLQPPATLAWTALWIGLATAALLLRAKAPLLFVGVFWFLWGHSLEGSFVALEPYFEHRNYLPSLGLWLALAGLLQPLTVRRGRILTVAFAAALLIVAGLTGRRAYQWGDLDRLLLAEAPPEGEVSRRLQVDSAIRAFERSDIAAQEAALDVLAQDTLGNRSVAALWSAIFRCTRGEQFSPAATNALIETAPPIITHNHMSYVDLLVRSVKAGHCSTLSEADMERLAASWLETARKPIPTAYVERLRAIGEASSAP